MKNIKRILGVGFIMAMASTFLIGCSENEVVPVEKDLPIIKMDSLKGNKLELLHEIEGFKFKTIYETGRYDFSKWRVTDSKNLKMSAVVEGVPEGTEVMIEHVHSDIYIKSISPQLDGLTQDYMDDSFHGVSQDGFPVSDKYAYENVFAIEGFSKDLMEGWSYYYGDYGYGRGTGSSISQTRLTEKNLINQGVYANKLQVVYDIIIKHEGEDKYHVKSIVDEILIPIIRPETQEPEGNEQVTQESEQEVNE